MLSTYNNTFVIGDDGYLKWDENWVTLLDTMLQIQILSDKGSGLRLPTRIKRINIDPTLHSTRILTVQDQNGQSLLVS